jgi:ankyrin repeat protein
MSLYLLTLIGPEEDLGRRYREGNTLLHYAGANGNLAFIKALVQRGVDLDASNDAGIRPLDFAVRLIEQYQAQGQDKLRELVDTPSLDQCDNSSPVLFLPIRQVMLPTQQSLKLDNTDEERRDMVAYFVQEGGADILAEAPVYYVDLWSIYDGYHNNGFFGVAPSKPPYKFLPLHMAACEGVKSVLDFFLTECGMPVDTRVSDLQLTALHCLALSWRDDAHLLPIVTWLVEEKGADVMCRDKKGHTAARLAAIRKKTSVQRYLQAQEEREKEAAAAAAVLQMQKSEEAMAALLLELEEEEQAAAAAGSKTKDGKTSSGKKKEKKK